MTGITKKNIRLADYVRRARKQKLIESFYSERSIHKMVRDELARSPFVMEKVEHGVALLREWMKGDYHESKMQRLNELAVFDLEALVFDVYTAVVTRCLNPMPIVNVASMCARKLQLKDQGDAILTMAEVLCVLAETDLYDITRNGKYEQFKIVSRIALDEEMQERANFAQFLPPMIHKPRTLKNNRHSGYWTLSGESVILGGYENHHDQHISLDVLNTMNSTAFEIDTDFISSVEETPSKSQMYLVEEDEESYDHMSTAQKAMMELERENWEQYKLQCYTTYAMMIHHGNTFHFQHKYDKRGRIYSYGYHINPQGNSFKKAMLNLKNKETVSGVDAFLADCK